MEFSWIYRLNTVTPLVPDYTEMERGEWFSVNAIDQWIEKRPQEISTVFRVIWQRCRQQGFIVGE